jgi:hypothetical protein
VTKKIKKSLKKTIQIKKICQIVERRNLVKAVKEKKSKKNMNHKDIIWS